MSTDVKPKGKARKARKEPPHFTPEFQRWARGHVSSESCAKKGARGFSATLAKHGPDVAFRGARKWRLSHPSSNELVMIGILSRLGIRYEREYRVGDTLYTVDFYLTDTNQAIEVNSRIHKQFDAEKRQQRKARKRKLLADLHIPCLSVWDTELTRSIDAVIRKVRRFVGRETQ
jgi:very-short-patch-repair endonuclease